jgi:hypothetical protein
MSSEIQNCPIERDEKWCRTCRHYESGYDRVQDPFGECHRNAPMPRLTTEEFSKETYYVDWPSVRFNAHCGEWAWDSSIDAWIDDPEENPRA